MRAGLPALAAFGSSFWTAALQLLAVRVYLSLLGIEAYGVVGFFVSLQAMLQILDLGLAPAVNREVARSRALGTMAAARTLLKTLSLIYWANGLLIAGALCLLAPAIASSWLRANALAPSELAEAIMLMGLIVAVRWPIAVYYNVLVGLGRLAEASLLNAAITTASVVGSIVAIGIRPDLQALFLTQAAVALAGMVAMRALAWARIGGRADARFQWQALRTIWRFSLGMGGVTLTAVALTQLDKLLLSRLLPLDQFGAYMVAASLTAGLLLMVTPLFGIIYPRFSALVAGGRDAELAALYCSGSQLFAALFLPIALALGIYGQEIVALWTGQAGTADAVAPIVFLLALGYAINGLMFFPYSLQLALGLSRIPLIINSAMLVVMVPSVLVLTLNYGAVGGAMAWPLLQAAYLIVGTVVTHRRAAIGNPAAWILNSVAIPFVAAFAVLAAFRPVVLGLAERPLLALAGIALAIMVTWAVLAAIRPVARTALIDALRPNGKALAT